MRLIRRDAPAPEPARSEPPERPEKHGKKRRKAKKA